MGWDIRAYANTLCVFSSGPPLMYVLYIYFNCILLHKIHQELTNEIDTFLTTNLYQLGFSLLRADPNAVEDSQGNAYACPGPPSARPCYSISLPPC